MSSINPYRRNCEIIRKFFAKPIFLVSGIAFLIFNLFELIISVFSAKFAFNYISCALGISFLIFFFTARSKKESVSFKAPIVIMDIVSIVGIVFTGLAALVCGFLSVALQLPQAIERTQYYGYEGILADIIYALAVYLRIICPIITVLSVILLLYFIAMEMTVLSFKKSLSNIYLQKKGATALGVISIVAALIMTACAALLFSIEPYFIFYYVLWFAEILIFFICTAVIGFAYNNYITDIAGNIETKAPEKSFVATKSDGVDKSFPLELWNESEQVNDTQRGQQNVMPPLSFEFETVFEKEPEINKQTAVCENSTDASKQNAYATPKVKHCENCGRDNPYSNRFCGSCGNKL